jgi:hypothetical protein
MPATAASLEGFWALFPDPSLPEFELADELADELSSDVDFELESLAEDGFAEGGFVEAVAALPPPDVSFVSPFESFPQEASERANAGIDRRTDNFFRRMIPPYG